MPNASLVQLHDRTQALIRLLSDMGIGEVISYSRLSETIHCNVQAEGKHHLYSARAILRREERKVYDIVPKVGVVRLDDVGKVQMGARYLPRIKGAIRRGADTVACVEDFEALPASEKVRHNTLLTIYTFMERTTRPACVKHIEQAVSQRQSHLALEETLQLFQR
jgi:hypothetical protein